MTFKEWWDQPTRVVMLPKGMAVKNGAAYVIAAERQAEEAWDAALATQRSAPHEVGPEEKA